MSRAPHRAAAGSALLALATLLAVVYATPNDAVWIVDCGNKALQARRLLETGFGTLNFDYPARDLDPEGRAFPIPAPFALPRGDGFVSQYPVAFAALAVPFLAALGEAGLRLPAALGAAACAVLFALWVAPALGRRWAAAGGLLLALATPLLFYGVTIWEHSLTVALSLAAWIALARPAPLRLLLAGLLAGAACWLREELALMGLALALAAYRERRRLADVAWLGLGALPAALGLAVFNALAFGHLLGIHVAANVGATPQLAPLLWGRHLRVILAGQGSGLLEGSLFAAALVLAWFGGAWAARRERALPALTGVALGVGLAAWLCGALRLLSSDHLIFTLARYNGLLLQMPAVCLAGVGAVLVGRRPALAPLRGGVTAGLGFLVLALAFRVTLTDPTAGGHWGPRMLLPALPALVALALVAIHDGLASPRPAAVLVARVGGVALVAAGLASSAIAIGLLDLQKRDTRQIQLLVLAARPRVVVTNHPALGQQLASIWGRKPLLLVRGPVGLRGVAASIGERGPGEFLYLHRTTSSWTPERTAGVRCRLVGRHRSRRNRYAFDLDLHECKDARPP